MTDTKICPYCAEEIKAAAIKCRYCQSDLTEPLPGASPSAVVDEPPGHGGAALEGTADQGSVAVVAAPTTAPAAPPPVSERGLDIRGGPRVAWLSRAAWLPRRDSLPRLDRLAKPQLVVALSVVAVLLLVAVGYLGWVVQRMHGAEEARTAGEVAAVAHVETILSYDHASFDKGTAQAERLMTPSFRKEYAGTVRLVRSDALSSASTVKAQVVASSVVDASSDRVHALLFVNQTTTGKGLKAPRVDLNRVVVTLVRDDGRGWLVDRLQAL